MSNNDGAERYRGYRFIKTYNPDGVKMEVWDDDPNEKNTEKKWKLIKSEIVKEKSWSKPKEEIKIDIKKYNPMSHKRYDKLKEDAKNGDVGAKHLLDNMAQLYELHKEEDPIGYKRSIENDLNEIPDFIEPKFRIDNPKGPIGWTWKSLREIPDKKEEEDV